MARAVIAVVEMRLAGAFRADAFGERFAVPWRSFEPVEPLDRVPRRGESARILDVNLHLELLAAIDHAVALHHMQLLAMWCAVVVDERLGVEPDRVDHQRVAFVVADGFAVP